MQPISSRLITFIGSGGSALISYARALSVSIMEIIRSLGRVLPSSTLARFSIEIPVKADALITMSPDDFRKKLNSGTLPDGPILVTGELHLTDNDALANLPAGLTVRRDLYLIAWTSLTSLPAGLPFGGSLYPGCTSLTSLPDRLSVGGELNLDGCISLTSLPEGLTVGRNLSLRDCTSLTSLPAGLTLGGGLDLSGCTSLTSLPDRLSVGGVFGSRLL